MKPLSNQLSAKNVGKCLKLLEVIKTTYIYRGCYIYYLWNRGKPPENTRYFSELLFFLV
jgi:hypothetical protein